MEKSIWAEKYRPKNVDDYVWRDDALKSKVLQWIKDRVVPHVLFSGDPGVGKTTLAYLVLSTIGIPQEDILYIPASRERKIDDIIDRIRAFTQTWAFGDTDIKYVILDEADTISRQAQMALRADLELYEANCRFIMTCNYPQKIIEPLQSRVESHHFTGLDHDAFTMRLVSVMEAEHIDVTNIDNIQAMVTISNRFYPDLRKSIGMLQQGCYDENGQRKLRPPAATETVTTKPFLIKAADLIAAGDLRGARMLIVQSATAEEYPDIYRWMYRSLHLWGSTEDQQDEALLAIRKGLVHHAVVADIEINLVATMVELKMIASKTK